MIFCEQIDLQLLLAQMSVLEMVLEMVPLLVQMSGQL